MRIKNKFIHIFSFLLLLCLIFATSAVAGAAVGAVADAEQALITTRSEFISALNDASDGDVLTVGDVDFNISATGAVNEAEKIKIEKSIVIKSGKADGKAVLTGATFILNGTKSAGETTTYTFENVIFDEKLDTSVLTDADWQLSYDSQDELIGNYPLKNQYAIECRGSANATFKNCEFNNYMHTYGPAIRAFYDDYSLTPSLEAEHGDNVPYKLELNIIECLFTNNAALYGGGAVYVEGHDKNVTLNVIDSKFTENKSGFVQNAVGGGAVYVKQSIANFNGCNFEKNIANYFYGGERYWSDQIIGGAIGCAEDALFTIRDCKIIDNKASCGGGIGVVTSRVDIADCLIAENEVIPETESKNSTLGLASNQGLGGAIYFNGVTDATIGNTEIKNNYAENAMSAIFTDYSPLLNYSTREVNILFCTIANNVCKTKMSEYKGYGEDRWLWFSWYTDFFDISYLKYYGNIVVDEIYATDEATEIELPSEQNGYNYFGNTAPSEWYDVEGNIINAPVVSTEFIKEKLGDMNYHGTFTVGANNRDVVYKFFVDSECDSTVTLPAGKLPSFPTVNKPGYTLVKWTFSGDFDYEEDKYFIVGNKTESIDFYATFSANTYKVTYNFGEAKESVNQVYDTALSLPTPQERYGYTFAGWFTELDGKGEKIEQGATFKTASDVTYYAYYTKDFPTLYVILGVIGGLVVIGAGVALGIYLRNKKASKVPGETQPTEVSQHISEQIVENTNSPDTSMLSPREKEVLELLLQGKQRNEIATILYISENTVKKNISGIYTKLNVSSRSELFALFK